jgi:diguanylate cyclase (GGDEF)-like protein
MRLFATLVYWAVVALWLGVLATVIVYYIRNPRIFGTTRLLLFVVGLDTCRNIIENSYFGLFFGSQYGFFPAGIGELLGNPALLIIPKLINVAAGCFVIGVLLMRWLPKAVRERDLSDKFAADLKMLATTDGLTGLTNRRQFDALARTEWLRFHRYGRPLSLLIVDVDNFKTINDRFGHDAGDLILKAAADNCNAAKRETDIVARLGGDEFALLLPETGEAAAEIVGERLRKQIHSYSHAFPDEDVQISVSVGVAGATLSMSAFEVLCKRADEALYEAKGSGRNRVVRAPRGMAEAYQVAAE